MKVIRLAVAAAVLAGSLGFGLSAEAGQITHLSPGGSKCIDYLGVTQSGGYYTARWQNWCTFGIWISYSRIATSGQVATDRTYISGADGNGNPGTGSANLYFSPDFDWGEVE